MAKKINHRGHGGHRELLFSLCPLCSLWFSKTHFQEIIKNTHDLLRSAYTVDEKVVFRIVATATVFETFTYQVSRPFEIGDRIHHEKDRRRFLWQLCFAACYNRSASGCYHYSWFRENLNFIFQSFRYVFFVFDEFFCYHFNYFSYIF